MKFRDEFIQEELNRTNNITNGDILFLEYSVVDLEGLNELECNNITELKVIRNTEIVNKILLSISDND